MSGKMGKENMTGKWVRAVFVLLLALAGALLLRPMEGRADTELPLYFGDENEQVIENIPEGSVYIFRLDLQTAASINVQIHLSRSAKTQVILENGSKFPEKNMIGTRSLLGGFVPLGIYYFKIYNFSGPTSLSIKAVGDLYETTEIEPNNEPRDAQTMTLGKMEKGIIWSADYQDYYKFEIPVAGTYKIFTSTTAQTMNLNYCDKDFAQITDLNGKKISGVSLYHGSVGSPKLNTVTLALAKGTYYLWMERDAFTAAFSTSIHDAFGYYEVELTQESVADFSYISETGDKIDEDLGQVSLNRVKAKKKGKIAAQWSALSTVDGYEVQYAQNKEFTNASKKEVSSASVTIKGLEKKKKYWVRVRAYKNSGSDKIYGNWSEAKKVKTKKK